MKCLKRGISLLEFVVSATIFSLIASATFALIFSTRLSITESNVAWEAENLARSILTEQLDRPFPELVAGTTEQSTRELGNLNQKADVTVSFDTITGYSPSELVKITVRVDWKRQEIARQRTLSALKPNLAP